MSHFWGFTGTPSYVSFVSLVPESTPLFLLNGHASWPLGHNRPIADILFAPNLAKPLTASLRNLYWNIYSDNCREITMGESPDSARSFPHNTIWRRLRRRCFIDWFTLIGVALISPPMLCSAAWIFHGPVWLIVCFGASWAFSKLFTATMVLVGMFAAGQIRNGSRIVVLQFGLVWQLIVIAATIVALLLGRIEWAIYCEFGLAYLPALVNVRTITWQSAVKAASSLAICVSVAAHAVWPAVCLLLVQFLPERRSRPSLEKVIRKLPTRAEYVDRKREACSTGGT